MAAATKTDAATFEVVKNSLYAVAAEMKVVLAKTAYSPILKAAGDYSCGVFDDRGEMVAQGPDLPIHLGSMPDAVRAVVRAWEEIEPGDVFVHNDPYFGGSHLPDVNVVSPAFVDGALLGFCCVRAHWPDIGSATPGSYGAVTDIYGEGLRLPPVRIHRGGVVNRDVEDMIFANVRTPDERRGDLRAQIAANRRASERLAALAGKYGAGTLRRIMQEVMDYSEAMMRTLLRDIPDGEGAFEDFCDGDGIAGSHQDETFDIRLRIIKQGDGVRVDFEGSDPQVAGPMNAPLSVTASGVFAALKMVIDSAGVVPPNSGAWRPVKVLAPEGSVVNAQYPAPVVYANHEMSHRICDMVFGALAVLVPDRVMACSQGTSAVLTLGGTDYRTGERYVSYETIKGGFGARPDRDGISAVASGISNTMNTPVELIEMSFPVRVESYELRPDSGGAGRWRGGLGTRRTWRILERDAHAAVCCERTKSPPFGIEGGAAGAPARISVVDPDGTERLLNSKGSFEAPAGALVVFDVPGSGGYGPPAERDPARLREDLADGYVTPEGARRDYGAAALDALSGTRPGARLSVRAPELSAAPAVPSADPHRP
ncbi:MAG: hydantoinase B/oxoprolinase family protein [Alphaproteobacteria bacterium]|nr:hydantoinase B/oxoprolinase family protein [Alphaproteobacteria bacterium]